MKKITLVLILSALSFLGYSQPTVPIKVTGTVVSTPTGTQAISGTVSAGGFTGISSSTITMSVAGAYATGDYMGTSTTPQTFTNVCRSSGGTGIISGLIVSDKIATANVEMELWLFSATFTAPTDNAAWAISDAEATTVIGTISLSTLNWKASSNNQVYCDTGINIPFDLPTGTSIYYAFVARGTTPAFTSEDLKATLLLLQD